MRLVNFFVRPVPVTLIYTREGRYGERTAISLQEMIKIKIYPMEIVND